MIRLLLAPSAVTLAFLAFLDLRRIHFEARWQVAEAVLVSACAVYLALRLYFGGRGPADTLPGKRRDNLAGCAGGLLLVGAAVALGAAVLGEGLPFGIIATVLIAGYVAAQFMLWPALLRALLAYVAITRGLELVLLLARYSPAELREQPGWAAVAVFGTVVYGAWFGMIAAAAADRLTEWREDRREERRASKPPEGAGICDVCGKPATRHSDPVIGPWGPRVVSPWLIRQAVKRGFDPFAAGLVDEATRAEWSRDSLYGSTDPLANWRRVLVEGNSSDWLLCPFCMYVLKDVFGADELRRLGLHPPP